MLICSNDFAFDSRAHELGSYKLFTFTNVANLVMKQTPSVTFYFELVDIMLMFV